MTQKDLPSVWAAGRIEAMADGSLEPAERERMLAAMREDSSLAQQVDAAIRLRRQLGGLPRPRPPRGLLGRLLGLPPRPRAAWPLFVQACGGIAVAVIAALLILPMRPDPLDEQRQAVREFVIAMNYLQRSAVLTQSEVGAQVGAGFADALRKSRESLSRAARSIE
jgi:hypothetical protein